jgi:hypothetical protein
MCKPTACNVAPSSQSQLTRCGRNVRGRLRDARAADGYPRVSKQGFEPSTVGMRWRILAAESSVNPSTESPAQTPSSAMSLNVQLPPSRSPARRAGHGLSLNNRHVVLSHRPAALRLAAISQSARTAAGPGCATSTLRVTQRRPVLTTDQPLARFRHGQRGDLSSEARTSRAIPAYALSASVAELWRPLRKCAHSRTTTRDAACGDGGDVQHAPWRRLSHRTSGLRTRAQQCRCGRCAGGTGPQSGGGQRGGRRRACVRDT